jgi:large conductance mechanosensitive channel
MSVSLYQGVFAMGLIKEFKDFAMKGNVVDMAVGIIIGAGFGKIVQSMVNDIIMPVVGAMAKTGSIGSQFLFLGEGEKPKSIEAAKEASVPYIAWGPFVQTTMDFLIVAFCVFMVVKFMNKAQSLTAADAPVEDDAPKPPPEDIALLREIRDSLKK